MPAIALRVAQPAMAVAIMKQRETLNVSMPSELKRYIAGLVSSGNYGSASEVVRAALRLLQEQNRTNRVAEYRERSG